MWEGDGEGWLVLRKWFAVRAAAEGFANRISENPSRIRKKLDDFDLELEKDGMERIAQT